MIVRNEFYTFFGLGAARYDLRFERDTYPIHEIGHGSLVAQLEIATRILLAVEVVSDTIDILFRMTQALTSGGTIVRLGAGRACPYCGTAFPSHITQCPNCGGLTELFDGIAPKVFPFQAIKADISVVRDRFSRLLIEMVATKRDFDMNDVFGNGDMLTLPYNHTFPMGYYLCQYCGMAVPEGHSCPGCGGQKIPLSELVKMDRECIYCGKKVVGGIVCPGCGARLTGLQIADFTRR